MPDIKIEVVADTVTEAMNRLAASGRNMSPAMMAIAGVLERQTEDNFEAEAGPLGKWPALSRATIEGRVGRLAGKTKGGVRKDGRISKSITGRASTFKMLQDTGRLAASVTSFFDEESAGIGSNAVYAAIHHLGGQAGRGRAVSIPARAYLPATEAGLQAGLEDDIMAILQRHLLADLA